MADSDTHQPFDPLDLMVHEEDVPPAKPLVDLPKAEEPKEEPEVKKEVSPGQVHVDCLRALVEKAEKAGQRDVPEVMRARKALDEGE